MSRLIDAILKDAGPIADEIDRYLAKADDNLEKTLRSQGYKKAKQTVKQVNDTSDEIADELQSQSEDVAGALDSIGDDTPIDDPKVMRNLKNVMSKDKTGKRISAAVMRMYGNNVLDLANEYMQDSDGGLVVDTLTKRTSAWMASWGGQLDTWVEETTQGQVSNLIVSSVNEGKSVAEVSRMILDGEWRDEYYQAQRISLTEMLRCHSVAQNEAIIQDPAASKKQWVHSGAYKIEPRPNHVKISGQIVGKDEPFVLEGADGNTYYPMYPRDPNLPPGESINCHCVCRAIADENILGYSLEERQQMQQDIIDARDASFDDEIDAKAQLEAEIARSKKK